MADTPDSHLIAVKPVFGNDELKRELILQSKLVAVQR